MFDWNFFVLYKNLPWEDDSVRIMTENSVIVFFNTKKEAVDYMNKKKFIWYKICISIT